MRLAVGLVHEVHTDAVAQFVPPRTVGVVGQSHGIDIGLLHQSQILKHALFGHHASRIGVVLVAVDTTNLDGLSVDEQLSVSDVDIAEAYLLCHALNGLPLCVVQL